MKPLLIVVLLAFAPVTAVAEDNPLPDEPTAADVANDPVPGQESGRTDAKDEDDGALRKIGRGVLFVPRVLVEVGFAPVRAGVYAVDRTSAIDRFRQFFFNKTGTFGLYPIIQYDNVYGLNAGARFVHKDLFGANERASLKASTGGRFAERFEGYIRSGQRLGDQATAELHAEFDRRPREPFYGIGNGDNMPLGRHRQELTRGTGTLDWRVAGPFHVVGAGTVTQLRYNPSSQSDIGGDAPIDTVYDPTMLTGWNGAKYIYGELELRWDDRRSVDAFDIRDIPADGWLLSAFVGRVHQLAGTAGDYVRYGADAQRFFRLGEGPRVLLARLHGEAVTGGYDEVVFTELPELGGGYLLRGYPWERFRDRVATTASLEYQWDLSDKFTMSLFADGGRVYPAVRDIEFKDMRLGFGTGLQMHNSKGFVTSITMASSIDGGFFVDVLFDPVYEVKPRVVHR